MYKVDNSWKSSITSMLSKLQCYRYFQIMMMSNNMENVAPHVIKVVARQVQALAQEKMEGINLVVNEDDMTDIQVRTKHS